MAKKLELVLTEEQSARAFDLWSSSQSREPLAKLLKRVVDVGLWQLEYRRKQYAKRKDELADFKRAAEDPTFRTVRRMNTEDAYTIGRHAQLGPKKP